RGVDATREALVELMAAMEKQFPGSREHSLFASVELSLRRMSPANREKARVLGVFHGGVDLNQLHWMMQWEEAELQSLAGELIERVGQARDAEAKRLEKLGDAWNHARFQAARTRIEQLLAGGRLREAFEGAQQLLQRARVAGDSAYHNADFDLAVACFLLARV